MTISPCRGCSAWDIFKAAMALHNMSHDDSERKSLVWCRSAGCSRLTRRTKDFGDAQIRVLPKHLPLCMIGGGSSGSNTNLSNNLFDLQEWKNTPHHIVLQLDPKYMFFLSKDQSCPGLGAGVVWVPSFPRLPPSEV